MSQAEGPAQTGDILLTFTDRNPLSTPKEIARRLALKPAETPTDYDISQLPFRAFVPTNYDPATPVGIIVYLGYKDTVATPPLWQPVLEKSHMIFIAPVCHHGEEYSPSVPLAQTFGLAMDAVYNLRHQYKIDDRRVYLMSWNTGGTQAALALSDLFTGFIITCDPSYFRSLILPNGSYFKPEWPGPPANLLTQAKTSPFFFIDESGGASWSEETLKQNNMQNDGFSRLKLVNLSLEDDLHYPNLKAEWFETQALPFLDAAAIAVPKPRAPSVVAATKPAAQSEAQHLLSLAHLYINNGRPELAKPKLQQILDRYPADPAAAQAKQMLDQLEN